MKFGITQRFSCSYLPDEQEQLLVLADETAPLPDTYGKLIQVGFRRSGEQIYRPHCPACDACQSVRIPVHDFAPSRSQKRVSKRCAGFTTRLSYTPHEHYYALYEHYITARHQDGGMYPPSRTQYEHFILCQWRTPLFIEAWDNDLLIAVAVTDMIDNGQQHRALSALYTFFHPDYDSFSLGTWMILNQIKTAQQLQRDYLYLGYYVGGCQKMSYKHQFYPYETFIADKWQRFEKKAASRLYTPPDIG
ncbi:arginyltransferase [Alteromonas sp. CYL-A6]|uniref:arginyltransferase n=1 Tax=Alteromonas nitratireducens TaxID=3390813 RepID=UPI0034B6DC0C